MRRTITALGICLATALTICSCSGAKQSTVYDHRFTEKAVQLIGTLPAGGLSQNKEGLVQKSLAYWTLSTESQAAHSSLFQHDDNGNQITVIRMPDGSLLMEMLDQNGNRNEVILQRDSETLRILNTQGDLLRMAALSP